ncbi:MAG: Kae1-associated kinase Bud32 [Candidatus Nanohaloarchaea archaeon]|jgi:Kae1-associated kinase Bud32
MTIRGAEAVIEFTDSEAVKKREKKKYRHPELDSKLREERTEREVRLLKRAHKYNVSVPEVLKISKDSFKMEKVEGEKLRDNPKEEYFRKMGEEVAGLHEIDVIHGDLTTSNVMVNAELKIIDFGLAFQSDRVEDRAVDIHLLKQVLESSHSEKAEKLWNAFLEGYKKSDEIDDVLERLEEVEQRGRYK